MFGEERNAVTETMRKRNNRETIYICCRLCHKGNGLPSLPRKKWTSWSQNTWKRFCPPEQHNVLSMAAAPTIPSPLGIQKPPAIRPPWATCPIGCDNPMVIRSTRQLIVSKNVSKHIHKSDRFSWGKHTPKNSLCFSNKNSWRYEVLPEEWLWCSLWLSSWTSLDLQRGESSQEVFN